jgi:L-asparaginase
MPPKLTLFTLGGTIASTAADPTDGARVSLTGDDLLRSVPEVRQLADIEVRAFRQVPSGDLRMANLVDLARAIEECFANGSDSVVVTQGTDTLEETSFALDLLVNDERPVVVTGAMRNPSLPGADGPANLLASVRVAAGGQTRGMGSVVVFNDEIHAARLVRKRHSTSTAAIGSPLSGPLGHVVEDVVRIFLKPPGRLTVRLPAKTPDVAVGMVSIGFDDDGRLLRHAAAAGYDGVVLAAFGGGHVPASVVPALESLSRAIPVVLSSRALAGPTLRHTYSYAGGEIDLIRRGLIPSGALDAVHARILLQVLLMAGVERPEIAAAFEDVLTAQGPRVIGRARHVNCPEPLTSAAVKAQSTAHEERGNA